MGGAEPCRVAAKDPAPSPSVSTFWRMSARASAPSSTNSAKAAPREIASMPSAPVPAKRSSTRAPLTGSP
jgi:hypothetical protein